MVRVRLLVAVVIVAVGVVIPATRADADTPVQCRSRPVPVSLSPGGLPVFQITGWACWRGTVTNKPVELLVPGFTYDHAYWDFPVQPDTYSYVTSATAAGYVTFTVDRLGTGLSSYPPSTALTAAAHVNAVHQVIAYLRGAYPQVPLISVGHSAGSGTVLQEAASYADVDGVIVTGLLHVPDALDATFFGSFYPALLDAKFAGRHLDTGYLTTIPGTRGPDFYDLTTADPVVIAEDELLKSTGSAVELASGDIALLPQTSRAIHVPVLLAIGQHDASFCSVAQPCDSPAEVLARESGDYAADACLEAYVLPGSGHVINLHPNAAQWFAAANDWMNRRAGAGCAGPPP
jgi:alpha-beta hydrolase superfamily lysophospholipase